MLIQPTVGRIVHYVTDLGEGCPVCNAGIVTGIKRWDRTHSPEWLASVAVFSKHGMFFSREAMYNEEGDVSGTWHWPEKVAEPVYPEPMKRLPSRRVIKAVIDVLGQVDGHRKSLNLQTIEDCVHALRVEYGDEGSPFNAFLPPQRPW